MEDKEKSEVSKISKRVKVDNRWARAGFDISTAEGGRILATSIAHINGNKENFFNTFILEAKYFVTYGGGKFYTRMAKVCKELGKSSVIIEDGDDDDPKKRLRVYPVFSYIEYTSGLISIRLNHEIAHFLLDLSKNFTIYSLEAYLRLPSIYSQRVFVLLESWKDRESFDIDIEDFHRAMNSPKSLRKNFKDCRVRILEKAEIDIHSFTSIKYKWEAIKSKGVVTKIRFTRLNRNSKSETSNVPNIPNKRTISPEVIQQRVGVISGVSGVLGTVRSFFEKPAKKAEEITGKSETIKEIEMDEDEDIEIEETSCQLCWRDKQASGEICLIRTRVLEPKERKCHICLQKFIGAWDHNQKAQAWSAIYQYVRTKLSEYDMNAWVTPLIAYKTDNGVALKCQDRYQVNSTKEKFHKLFEEAKKETGYDIEITYIPEG